MLFVSLLLMTLKSTTISMTSFTIFYFDVFFWHGKSLYICITKAFAVLLHAINLYNKNRHATIIILKNNPTLSGFLFLSLSPCLVFFLLPAVCYAVRCPWMSPWLGLHRAEDRVPYWVCVKEREPKCRPAQCNASDPMFVSQPI